MDITQEDVNELCAKMLVFANQLAGSKLFNYQSEFFLRIVEALIIGEAAELSILAARQSGKTESVGRAIAASMVLLPSLAKVERYSSLLNRFEHGVKVGVFAPTDDQSRIAHGRVAERLSTGPAEGILESMGLAVTGTSRGGVGKVIGLSNGSLVRRQTASPTAKIEGTTYHLALIDEAQDVDEKVLVKSVAPMLAFTGGTRVLTGTPTVTKGYFYKLIQTNKREETKPGSRQLHLEAGWEACAAENQDYKRYVQKEMLKLGEDSDEFSMSYRLQWKLTRGLFIPRGRLDHADERFLGDRTMGLVHEYHQTPVVLGIDPARTTDSTVVTALWVNWQRQDPYGNREVRILNWLEITNEEWETQYRRILAFAANYDVLKVRIDSQGMGSAVAERLKLLMGNRSEVQGIPSDTMNQEIRWKALLQLFERGLIAFPAAPSARKSRRYRRFIQQMDDLEKHYVQGRMLARAPNTADAHDDYPDSLALACLGAAGEVIPTGTVTANPFFGSRRKRR